MGFLDDIREFFQGLIAEGARSLTTLFGIAWGTVAVILLVAFGQGLQRDLQARAKALGEGLVVGWPQKTTLSFAGMTKGRVLRLRAEDVMALSDQIPDLGAVSAEYQGRELMRFHSQVHSVRLSGVYPSFEGLRLMIPQSGGRFINRRDIEERRRVIFLGDRIKEDLFGNQMAVGRIVTLRGIPFTVIGVLRPKVQDSDYGGKDENRVYLPATTFSALFNRDYISNFVFRARNIMKHDQVVSEVYRLLGRKYQFDPRDRAAIALWDTTEDARLLHYFFLGFNTVMGSAGGFTLVIGGIGVANLLFIMVRQRTREIAISMAVGARPLIVMFQVLGQAVGIVFLGGSLGVLGAFLVIRGVSGTTLTTEIGDPFFSPVLALMVAALLVLVGLVAGYFPARRAARLDPAKILAEE